MHKTILKYMFSIVLIVFFANILCVLSAYFWIKASFMPNLTPIISPKIEAISMSVYGKVEPKKISKILEEILLDPNINKVSIVDRNDNAIYAQGHQKFRFVFDFLSFKIPLKVNTETLGYLRVWPTEESIVFWLTSNKNIYVLFALFVLWWSLTVVGIYLYLNVHTFSPLMALKHFVDQVENNNFITIKLKTKHTIWKEISQKLNRMNEKFADNSDTLQMLFSASRLLTSSVEINEIFNTVLTIIQKKFEGASCSVLLLEEDGFLRIKTQRGISPDLVHNIRLRPGEDFAGKSFVECNPVIINDIDKENSALTLMLKEKEGLVSFVFIPLLVESKCVGLLNANSYEKNYFTTDKVKTLSTLAEYLSIGLCNAKLYERIQEYNRRLGVEVSSTTRELMQTNSRLIQKVKEMKALSDISAASASKGNFYDVLHIVIKNIKELLSVQSAGFFLYSSDTEEMVPYPPFFGIQSQDFSKLRFKVNDISVFKSMIFERKNYILNNTQQAREALPFLGNVIDIKSLILVPLWTGKKNIGVIAAANRAGSEFDKEDLRVMELIADRMSVIIENLKLYQELEHRLRDMTTLQEISSSISGEPDMEKILKKIIASTTKAFNADLCDLFLLNEDTKELVSQPGGYFTGGAEAVYSKVKVDDQDSPVSQIFREGENFITPDASIDPQIRNQVLRLIDIRSLIMVVLKTENRNFGILRIGKHQPNYYTKDYLALAELIAQQASIIIDNARLYDAVCETKNELEKLNKIKNEFISVVSHELKTPISAIKGFMNLVLNKSSGDLNDQQEKFLGIADKSIDRLMTLVAELVDISQIESGKIKVDIKALNAADIIKDVVNRISTSPRIYGKNVDISLKLPEKLPFVLADNKYLYQVFENLLVNSINFTPDKGKITIFAEDRDEFVLFGVRDNGVGIAEKDKKKVFEKFYRVDSRINRTIMGAGLGLSIVKSIIELLGGEIWVDAESSGGSIFQFVIPSAKSESKNIQLGLQ
jgi:signal transduction histidine kinase/putative methionine-R-sulfoxide reductase with GAF domain